MKDHTRPVTKLVIHNTELGEDVVTRDGKVIPAWSPKSYDTCSIMRWVSAVRKLHVEKNGWEEIGYHGLLSPWTGEMAVVRPFGKQGAHCKGRNDGTVAVAILGDWRARKLDRRIAHAVAATALYLEAYFESAGLPHGKLELVTHAELALTPTDCGTGGLGEMVNVAREMLAGFRAQQEAPGQGKIVLVGDGRVE